MKETLIGRTFGGHDNGTHLVRFQEGLNRCTQCGELLDRHFPLTDYKPKKKYDVGATYDNFEIVSQRFKDIWEQLGATGLIFTPLPAAPGFYLLEAEEVLEFDAERYGTTFTEWRPCCQRYRSIVGATPAHLKHPERLKGRKAFRTDLMFGSGDEKNPLILLPLDLANELNAFKLVGVSWDEVLA